MIHGDRNDALSAEGPALRTRVALYLAVVLTVALAFTSIFLGSEGPRLRVAADDVTRPVGGALDETSRGEVRRLVGRVFLERVPPNAREAGDRDEGTGGAIETAQTGGAEQADEGDLDEDDLPMTPATSCAVSVWRSGEKLGDGVCDEDGRFTLRLPASMSGEDAVTSVEVLVPRYLRASLPLTGSAAVPFEVKGVDLDVGAIGLGPAVPLRGVVLDASGAGVPNVTVEAMPVENLGEPEPWRALTDAQGQFEYHTVPRGPLRVSLLDPRYAPSVVDAVAPDDEVVLPVSLYRSIKGSVRYEAGLDGGALPVAVRLQGSGVWPPRTVKVAGDGSFVFEKIPDGVYAVEALAFSEDGATSFASDIIEDVVPDEPVELTLQRSGWVRVQVLGPGDQAVAAARVTAGFGALSMLQKVGTTDEGGFATVGPLGMGSQIISVAADGFLPAPGLMVDVGAASDGAPLQVRLTRPQTLRGRVVDPGGRPAASAVVELVASGAFVHGEHEVAAQVFSKLVRTSTGSLGVTTGPVPDIPLFSGLSRSMDGRVPASETGDFEFRGLVPGLYTLVAYEAGYARSVPVEVRVPRASRDLIVLTLRAGVSVEGRVVDHRGAPLERATLRVLEDGEEIATDARGRFDMGTRTGMFTVIVRAKGFAPRKVSRRIEDTAEFFELALEPANGRLAGRIRGGNDRVVEGAMVRLRYADPLVSDGVLVSDARGLVEAEGLVEGAAMLELTHPDHVDQTRAVEVGARGELLELTMVSGWELQVEVRDRRGGDRLFNARIMVDARGARTDRRGEARFSHLPPGEVVVEVMAEGYVPSKVRLRGDDEGRLERRVELDEGGSVEGHVRDDVGIEVPNVRVEVVRPGDGVVLGAVKTDARGRFRVDSLPPGSVEVRAQVPTPRRASLADARLASDVLPGQVTRDVFLRFDRLGSQN